MMESGNDPLESFLNSVEAIKNALLPVESNFRKGTRNLEHCFNGVSKHGSLKCSVNNEVMETRLDLLNEVSCKNIVNSDNRRKRKGLLAMFVAIFEEKNGSNVCTSADVGSDELEFNVKLSNKGLKGRHGSENDLKKDGNSLNFDLASSLINGFVQFMPRPFNPEKTLVQVMRDEDILASKDSHVKTRVVGDKIEEKKDRQGKDMPFESFIGFVVGQLDHLPKFDFRVEGNAPKNATQKALLPLAAPLRPFDHFRMLFSILEGKRADVNGFFGNLKFAHVGGASASVSGEPPLKDTVDEEINNVVSREGSGAISPQKLANGFLSSTLSNVERLRSTLSAVSLTELIQLLPQVGRPSEEDHPDKKKLFSVQDFFRYTEDEGKRFFEELDRDADGKVTMEDLEVAMRKRKLPKAYAHEFMRCARSHLFSKSFGWRQFLSLMEQKEPTILRAYMSLCLSKSGKLQKNEILASLQNAGLPANEDNASVMMRFLNADTEESISYGHFRNFMLLLPSDRLKEDPRSIWFEAATVVVVLPPVEIPARSVLKSALAGGLSCAFSTAVMHPVDTVKTQVQASTLSFLEILAKLPQIGTRGLYRGLTPAILGQFSSHGLRMGIFEVTKGFLMNVAPTVPELQVESAASFCSTILGTAMRIPCEVLKQRLQAGLFDSMGEAIIGTWRQDGLGGFFRGTGVTLLREVPFYVAGMGLYAQSKKAVQRLVQRELEPWETIVIGALSGGLTAVLTTPFDVIKTRMMTTQGSRVAFSMVAVSILRQEGPLGLFKGAVPRFFWIAPLGSINFAGYELARKAMDRLDSPAKDVVQK